MALIKKITGQSDKTIKLGGAGNPTSIDGYFLGTKTTADTGYGPGKLHMFSTAEGVVGVWGKTAMNNSLTQELVGQRVVVTFLGMKKSKTKGRSPFYDYSIEHDPENTMDVSELANWASGGAESSDESYEDEITDEIAPARTAAPRNIPAAASPTQQARVKEALAKRA